MKKVILAALMLTIASPVMAMDYAGDHNGAAQLASGDYAMAERVLARSLRVNASDPELLLNLATVYANTGRVGQARALYARVLSFPDERLALSKGQVARAHALAKSGLDQTRTIQLAAR